MLGNKISAQGGQNVQSSSSYAITLINKPLNNSRQNIINGTLRHKAIFLLKKRENILS
jgi:hypothetical protein